MEDDKYFTVSATPVKVFFDANEALQEWDEIEGPAILQLWSGQTQIYPGFTVVDDVTRERFRKQVAIPRRIAQLQKIKKEAEDELAKLKQIK
jgi:hypothetical protein